MALEAHGIYQVGRYGRWAFQGIADSIRDGFIVGGKCKIVVEGKLIMKFFSKKTVIIGVLIVLLLIFHEVQYLVAFPSWKP